MRRHLFADHIQEVVATHISHELELLPRVFNCGREVGVGTQIRAKPTMFLVQLNEFSGVADYYFKFSTFTNHPFIPNQSLDVIGAECRYGFYVEVMKCFS